MEESQGKRRIGYNAWSAKESSTLLELMVDAANRGWCNTNGVLSKQVVEKKILPALNEKLGCQKNYAMYQSRLSWFKQQYHKYSELMRYSSGFGWDLITKKFIASDEVWDNYFESHPKQRHLRTDTFPDYEDLRIAIDNVTATGRNSISLGDESDARIYGVEENRHVTIDDYVFDESQEAYVQTQQDHSTNAPSSNSYMSFPSFETMTRADVQEKIYLRTNSITGIATDIREMFKLMEKRERDREKKEMEDKNNIWDAIKEIPNLDNHTRYKAPAFIHKFGMKDAFLKISHEER
ncbi:uncharacterized protein At2g29880-like [Olea europaea var. sylvestris]|uniref:uncharacterized protein At2g29880-like n=1 Tax=Olea europaea var. sylvestris TaxID=158386 RepID=UPI000C1D6464|nr:uncharacterized protein At2g29880-like [Olea europaea var. sylvestris]